MVRVEGACLALATAAGLQVPTFEVATFGHHAALLITRFDVFGTHGRRHMLSMQTLLGAEHWYQLGYGDLADLLRQVSARREQDVPALYRQAVFNVLIGNTDDHLKNFAMQPADTGWRLTPAYDLTPDEPPRGEPVLHFGPAGHRPDAQALAELARAFGLSSQASRWMCGQVADAIGDWCRCFNDYGISETDRERLAPGIDRRLASLPLTV